MQSRIGNVDVSLDASLCRCFQGGLERRDDTVIYHCLRAYAAIDNTTGAEEALRSALVAPFVQKIVPPNPGRDAIGVYTDSLAEILEEIKAHIQTDCQFLLDKAAAGDQLSPVFLRLKKQFPYRESELFVLNLVDILELACLLAIVAPE